MEKIRPAREQPTESATDRNEAATKEFWRPRAPEWGLDRTPHWFFTDFVDKHKKEFGTEVADIGCGPGIYADFLAKEGFNVHGVDLDEEMIRRAREKSEKSGLTDRIHFAIASQRRLPFPNESMDSALSTGVMHFNDWDGVNQSFQELQRILKPGTYLLMQARSVNNTHRNPKIIENTPAGCIVVLPDDPHQMKMHYFTGDGLIELGKQHGFDIVEGPFEASPPREPDQKRWRVVFKKRLQE